MKFLVLKRTPMMNKSKKHTGNLLSNGILIKISKIINRQNKSSDKSHKPMKYFLIRTKEKTTICMDTKDRGLRVLHRSKETNLISMMLKIFSNTFLKKIPLKMTFLVGFLEEIRQKKSLLLKREAKVSVHLMMIHFFQMVLEEGLEDLVWVYLELSLYLTMMIFSQTRKETFL